MNRPSKVPARWLRSLGFVAAAVALLTACGGGTTQYDPFVAQRVISFGDDASTLTVSGHRHGVNGLNTDGVFDCRLLPIWTQSLANYYGYVFAECNPDNVEPRAIMKAAAGARIADVAAQVESMGAFRDRDLAAVMAGAHDIFDIYLQYPQQPESVLIEQARESGRQMARVVNRMVSLGAKVIVANLPDLGLTPYARRESVDNDDPNRAALISRLTTAFNEQLGVTLLLDGRFVGLVQIDLISQAIGRFPGAYGFTNISDAVCANALPDCTTGTLVENGNATTYLWANDKQFAPSGHSQLAVQAIGRAQSNPF
ncbi:MAG: esterase [Rubrivivax sp.]|nr:esterase [Rubrivivax sp.]